MVSEEHNSDVELASEVIPVPRVQPEVKGSKAINVTNEESNNIHHGKVRRRKKALHAAILKQMEFYFGDSNLSKDRYLAELIKQDPSKF
jgi:La-related protein 7